MLEALPDRTLVEAAVVISQPGPADPSEPHLLTSSGGDQRPSQTLIRTAADTLATPAQAAAGLDGALGQIARLALPAAAGHQAPCSTEGVDAVAISGAGEVQLRPRSRARAALGRIDRAVRGTTLALVGALDAAAASASRPRRTSGSATTRSPGGSSRCSP